MEAKDITGLGTVLIKPLDDPGNPYRAQYEAWDEWVYDNVVLEPIAFEDGQRPADFKVLKARVTAEGYLLPQVEKARIYHEQMANGYDNEEYGIDNIAPFAVQAAGVMDPGIDGQRGRAVARLQGEYYLPVPDWLAADPPIWSMLLPNGDVVTHGALGSGAAGSNAGCCGSSGHNYYRYTHDGELVRTSSVFWWELYFDDVGYPRPEGNRKNRHDGYVYFTDPETDETLSVWDWDGTKLETTLLPPVRDIHPFVSLRPAQIRDICEGQQGA